MARRDPFESFPAVKAKKLPFPFVLEELAPLDPVTRPMFGALGVYVGERIVMILRDKGPDDADSGVWLAFDPEHEAAVISALPRLGPIELFRTKVAGWKKLSSRSAEFDGRRGRRLSTLARRRRADRQGARQKAALYGEKRAGRGEEETGARGEEKTGTRGREGPAVSPERGLVAVHHRASQIRERTARRPPRR